MKRTLSTLSLLGCVMVLAPLGVGLLGGCSDEPLVLEVTVPEGVIPADGKTGATIEVKVSQGGTTLDRGEVRFASALSGSSFSPIRTPSEVDPDPVRVTISAGSATAKLYSIGKGTAKVSITYTYTEWRLEAREDREIIFSSTGGAVSSLKHVSATPTKIQIKGSGGTEVSQVVFQAIDAGGQPVKGADILFALDNPVGGANVDPGTAKSSDDGTVRASVHSGTVVGTVKVQATVKNDPTIVQMSETITIAGASPSYKNFDFVCDRRAVGGFLPSALGVNLQVRCTAHVADRNSQKVPNQLVTFIAEAGAIDQTKHTDAFGAAEVTYKTQEPLPREVDPNYARVPDWMRQTLDSGEEPSLSNWPKQPPFRPCPRASCNLRDGLVTIIAVTSGEEEWNDQNGNKVVDPGEFVDLPEPFVDLNDSGVFDDGEPYLDANDNKRWDPANGKWDSSTQIWRATKLVWTGDFVNGGFFVDQGQVRPAASPVRIPHRGAATLLVTFVDDNTNLLAFNPGDSIACKSFNSLVNIDPPTIDLNTTLVGQSKHGRRFVEIRVVDKHASESTDCKAATPPCPDNSWDRLTCTGNFTSAQTNGGPVAGTTSIDLQVDAK